MHRPLEGARTMPSAAPVRSPAPRAALALVLLAGLSGPAAWATTRFVDGSAPPGGDGRAWSTAFATLQDALLEASTGGVEEIRVAGGIYRPDRGGAAVTGDRGSHFRLIDGVAIRGGFGGVSSADPDARDLSRWPSVLCGDLAGNDDGEDPARRAENAFQVVVATDIASSGTLDGFIIRRGHADGPGFGAVPESMDQGAGINIYDASPVIIDCILEDHYTANHGAVNDHGHATFIRCTFRNNVADLIGAGLYSHHHSATHAVDCLFENNSAADHGAGGYTRSMTSVYERCEFRGNAARRGAGFYMAATSAHLMIDCVFTDNVAEEGGAIYNDGGIPRIERCLFQENHAPQGEGGGAIWNEGGAGEILECTFLENTGTQGGGIYNRDSNVLIDTCTFLQNSAGTGGALWSLRERPTVRNSTFVGNQSRTGGAIYNEESFGVIADCFFAWNAAIDGDGGGGMVNAFDSGPTIRDCVFIENLAANDLFGGGGGMANYISSAQAFRCVFIRNTATLGGGAIYNELDFGGLDPSMINCRFEGNTASDGGAILNFRSNPLIAGSTFVGNRAVLPGPGAAGRGGAILNHYISRPTITSVTITANEAGSAGGGVHSIEAALPVIRNSILQDNHAGSVASDLSGDADIAWCLGPDLPDGPGMVRGRATFVAAPDPGPDGTFGSRDDDFGDLRLAVGSLAIDAGATWLLPPDRLDIDGDEDRTELLPRDLGGHPRVARAGRGDPRGLTEMPAVDMGAYEHPGVSPDSIRVGDVTGDGVIDGADLVALLYRFGRCPPGHCAADFDLSGTVDLIDLLRLLAAW